MIDVKGVMSFFWTAFMWFVNLSVQSTITWTLTTILTLITIFFVFEGWRGRRLDNKLKSKELEEKES